jgi:hypothetical protein
MPPFKQATQIHIVPKVVLKRELHKAAPRISYRQAETTPEAEIRLNRGFDRLFEEVLKMDGEGLRGKEGFDVFDN